MKRKASLLLMEQLIMILVFALAAAICLRVFAASNAMADRTARRDEAVVIARNAAELLQAGADPAILDTGDCTLQIEPQDSGVPGLAQARISVLWEDEPLFVLTTGWQEVAP